MEQRPHLEAIQEVSEQEDETEGSEIVEGNKGGEETKGFTTEDESDGGENDGVLRVLRPRRVYRPHGRESLPQRQSASDQWQDVGNLPVSSGSDEATPAEQARSANERRPSGELRIKIAKLRWPKRTPHIIGLPPAQRGSQRRRRRKGSPFEESFPEWLAELMVNIEEATTHQLLVE